MNAKQRFFDAAFNNEPYIGLTCVNSYKAINVTKHQLFDAPNSNILNKNVLNTAEAAAVSNISSKISRRMFFPTTFLQNVKDKCKRCNKMIINGTSTVIFIFRELYINWWENAHDTQIASQMHFHKCM